MFENIIGQSASVQLKDDILSRRQAPSMLFFGPPESGKGSTALELARLLSCTEDTSWKCACPSCERHRYLQHSDLLILGPRRFSAEIAASCSAFLREPSRPAVKMLFIRSLRKLLSRFSPVLVEGDPKLGKIASVLQSLEESLNELEGADTENQGALEKLCGSLVKDALKLEDEGMGDTIPIGHIRRAAYWCRLAPNGKRKTLLLENAESMRDEARNSLLKLLEEPPDTVSIVLTSQRREAIMPTILSRLRPYRFLKRSAESEREVLQKIFRKTTDINESSFTSGNLISAYLDSFLPQSTEKLYPVAAYFIASLAQSAAQSLKKKNAVVPQIINAIPYRYAPIADAAGFTPSTETMTIIRTTLAKSGNFEDGSFPRFLKYILDMLSPLMREAQNPQCIAYNDLFRKYTGQAQTATEVLNQNVTPALEALFHNLKAALTGERYE